MSWWHFENWNPDFFTPAARPHVVEYVGGPFDGKFESRAVLAPLVCLQVSAPVIDANHSVEGSPDVVVTSIAKYILYSRDGRWIYTFGRSRSPIPLPHD